MAVVMSDVLWFLTYWFAASVFTATCWSIMAMRRGRRRR